MRTFNDDSIMEKNISRERKFDGIILNIDQYRRNSCQFPLAKPENLLYNRIEPKESERR